MKYNPIEIPYKQDVNSLHKDLSITPSGRIGLTKAFVLGRAIPKDPRARLFYDETKKAIIITFASNRMEAAYPVGFTKQYGAYIVAGKFFAKIGLNPEDYLGRYGYKVMKPEELGISDIKGSVFILDLVKSPPKDN